MDQFAHRLAAALDEGQPEPFHVVEVPIEGGWRDTGQLRDLAQAQGIETPARGQLGGGGVE